MTDLPGGKKGVALSDGMGSGEEAFQESSMVVELLEELLNAGFPVKTAVQIMTLYLSASFYISDGSPCFHKLAGAAVQIEQAQI